MAVRAASAPSTRLTADETTFRPGRPEDAEEAGRICYEAFRALVAAHNFPPDFPSAEIAAGLLYGLPAHTASAPSR